MGLRLKLLLPLLLLATLAGSYLLFHWAPAYVAHEMQDRRTLLRSHMEFLHHELLEHAQQGDQGEVRAHMLALVGAYADARRVTLKDPAGGIDLTEGVSGADLGSPDIERLTVPEQAGADQSTLTLHWDASRERDDALARTQRLQATIAGLIGAMLLTVYLLLEYRVRRPVLRLAHANSRLADGDTGVSLPTPGNDEIGVLVNDFARMRARLAAGRQALIDARDSLDEQVRVRTEELECANSALYAEVGERRVVESDLQQTLSELRQQKQVIDLHAIVSIADRNGCITYANDKFCEVSGYSRAELLGQDHRILNSGQHPQGFFREMWSVIGNGGVWRGEVCNRNKRGELYWVNSTIMPFLDESGKPYQYISIRTDITQRYMAEQALRLSEARFKGIAESMSDWIWDVDAQGQYTWCSSGVEHLLGIRAEDMVGQSIFDWLSSATRQDAQRAFAGAAAARQPFKDIEICVTGGDGRRACLLMSGIPLIDGGGALTGYTGICLDISARKETEHMLERARDTAMEALRMKTEFLANVSHEVRTPLHGMLGLLGLLRDVSLPPHAHEYIELAHGAGESLLALVNNILDFSRLETRGLMTEEMPVEPTAVIDEVMQLHSGSATVKGLRLERRIDAQAQGLWRGDPQRLAQVLGNLLNNAIKFTPAGDVTLGLEVDADGALRFSVRDSGPGITPEYQVRVFEPFVQGDGSSTRVQGGSGLGLAICKQLVERMGGCIGVESTPGAGSCFWFTLPWTREAPRQQACCSP